MKRKHMHTYFMIFFPGVISWFSLFLSTVCVCSNGKINMPGDYFIWLDQIWYLKQIMNVKILFMYGKGSLISSIILLLIKLIDQHWYQARARKSQFRKKSIQIQIDTWTFEIFYNTLLYLIIILIVLTHKDFCIVSIE